MNNFVDSGVQCSWVSKLLLVRGDVISWARYRIILRKINLDLFTKSFLRFIRKDNSIWIGCKLHNRVIILVNTSMLPVIAGK